MIESVVFDIGSTLVREDRYWGDWADWLGVPRHTLSALVGAVVAQGRDDKDAIRLVRPGVDIDAEWRAREAAGRGEWLDESDVYPDVRSALGGLRESGLRESGLRVVLAGNQSLRAGELLRELGLPVDAVATSSEWGVAKPDPEFFRRVLELGGAAPGDTLYVGDYPAFDIRPAKGTGLWAAHIRRGPWAYLWADTADAAMADWRIDSLSELVEIVAESSA
ncbi:HAD family hydrolase [Streptomyces sp. 11-1-2]|uniref:HAD family hydrolase n=1 Tax=unclassified Streptomyces TaxID=2593676 RepID=UPI000B8D20B6|nr:HAD family hydrolase [Streptomyces sp. 11-1-2]ASQ98468.1 hydrolase [Streptomyces sp. 11-1-2]